MKLKQFALASTAALAIACVSTSADATALIQGTGIWGSAAPVTAYSAPGEQFQFSFVVPNPLDSNPTTSISDFFYSLDGTVVATSASAIQFYDLAADGMFDIFFPDAAVDIYGADIGSTGVFPTAGIFPVTSSIDNVNEPVGFGTGTVTVTSTLDPVVPEPASWAMMMLGMGLVGGALRTRVTRQKLAVSYS